MAARRATSEVVHLRVVRDEDVGAGEDKPFSENFYFDRRRTVSMKTARQFVIPRAVPFLVKRALKKRRPCAAKRPALLPTTQFPLALYRLRKLDVYGARPRSIGNGPLSKKERAELKTLTTSLRNGNAYRKRPQTYGDCLARTGPCGYVSCRHNLYLEVDYRVTPPTVKLNFPGLEIDEIGPTCSLKVAGEGSTDGGYYGKGRSLPEVGELLNLTNERVRQIEHGAIAKAKAARRTAGEDGE